MKYYIIAGEASGDLHASRLIRAIRENDSHAVFRAWGGDLMQEEGAEIVKHYRELAFMGFIEVIRNLPTILGNMGICKKDMIAFNPDVVVFVDYPGFNIPMARFAKHHKFKTVYYISPQVWAWKEKRVKILRKVIDRMIVILPFEKAFYQKWNYETAYVGHPLIEIIDGFNEVNEKGKVKEELGIAQDKTVIALLPGSRIQEIKKKLPIMLEATKYFKNQLFVVAQATSLSDELINSYTASYPNVKIIKGETYKILSIADAAVVTSGTATLETALFQVPEVVCYKSSSISYAIGKRLIKVPYISLVNLIMNKPVVDELIQDELTPENIKSSLEKIIHLGPQREAMQNEFKNLYHLLKAGGAASKKAAEIIHQLL
jgi:lipid-A-disaccharide synthase